MHSRCLCGRSISNGTHGAKNACAPCTGPPMWRSHHTRRWPQCWRSTASHRCRQSSAGFVTNAACHPVASPSFRLFTGRLQADGWGRAGWKVKESRKVVGFWRPETPGGSLSLVVHAYVGIYILVSYPEKDRNIRNVTSHQHRDTWHFYPLWTLLGKKILLWADPTKKFSFQARPQFRPFSQVLQHPLAGHLTEEHTQGLSIHISIPLTLW